MRAFVSTLSTPKAGSTDEECEDACAVDPVVNADEIIDLGPILACVADGASESLLSKHWARTLTAAMVRVIRLTPEVCWKAGDFAEAVQYATNEWDNWLSHYLVEREELHRPVRWYEQPGLERGAHATVLAARFGESTTDLGDWHAGAIGDTCLFQVRDDQLIHSFPATSSLDFGSSPSLVNSKNKDLSVLARHASFASGSYVAGDQFFIGTDALAAWFLDSSEQGGRPWEPLSDVSRGGDQQEFGAWVEQERQAERMRNDDVTVVHVDLG
jgi:hypothetical protein